MFNWSGNKIKYIDIIEKISKNFPIIVDPMMGSGNILISLSKKHCVVGSDIIKLMPTLFNNIDTFKKDTKTIKNIIHNNNNFINKNDYYSFRKFWNKKYLDNNFDEYFLIETFLLLKMCSNSMVRFNSKKNYFNQGFRGTKDNGFFYKTDLSKYSMFLNSIHFDKQRSIFYVKDVINFLNEFEFDFKKTIFIFDPPYMAPDYGSSGGYYSSDFEQKIDFLFEFIIKNNPNFILFNFLKRNNVVYEKLNNFIKSNNFNFIELKNRSWNGQNKIYLVKTQEIIISNQKLL